MWVLFWDVWVNCGRAVRIGASEDCPRSANRRAASAASAGTFAKRSEEIAQRETRARSLERERERESSEVVSVLEIIPLNGRFDGPSPPALLKGPRTFFARIGDDFLSRSLLLRPFHCEKKKNAVSSTEALVANRSLRQVPYESETMHA